MSRQERIQVTLTPLELQWLRWWAAQTGRTPSAAAARLLSERIEEVANRPSNLLAFKEDQAREELPAAVLEDLVRAYLTPGVTGALQGDQLVRAPEALRAARYLEELSLALERRATGSEPAWPARLAAQPAPPARRRAVETVYGLITANPAVRAAIERQVGLPVVSEKGQLSDPITASAPDGPRPGRDLVSSRG